MDLSRISACTYAVRLEGLDSTFQLLVAAGCRKVDLWGGLPNYSNNPAECDVKALKAKAQAYGLRIANLGTYPGLKLFEVGREAEMQEMRQAIDNAAFLGARSIRVCAGKGEDPGMIPALIPFFQESAAYATTQGVYLGIENHNGNLAGNMEHCGRLMRGVNHPHFGVLFEPANLMHCKVDCKDAWRELRTFIVHIHVKDSRWVGDKYERTMLGEGTIDYAWVAAHLEADGYRGDYALEFEIQDVVPIADGLPKWLAYFRGI